MCFADGPNLRLYAAQMCNRSASRIVSGSRTGECGSQTRGANARPAATERIVIFALASLAEGSELVEPAQARMARAALNWSLADLAAAAGVHRNTIFNFETGKYAGSEEALAAVRAALESAGVEFIAENDGRPGGRLRKGGAG